MTWGRGSTRQTRRERATVLTSWPTCYLQYPGCTQTSTEDDHIIGLAQWQREHRPGNPNALTNRRGACHHCHHIKSQHEATDARHARKQQPPEPHPGLINP